MATLAILAMLVYSTSFWALVLAIEDIPPVTLGLLRSLLASVFMFGLFLFLRARGDPQHLRPDRLFFAGMKRRKMALLLLGTAMFGTAVPNVLQNVGMEMMDPSSTSSLTSLIQGVSPVFTILLAWAVLKEPMTFQKAAGLSLAIPATAVLTTYSSGGLDTRSQETLGALLNLLTAASYSISGLFLKKALDEGARPISVIAINGTLGTLLQIPVLASFWALGAEDPTEALDPGLPAVLSLIYLSVGIYAITSIVWYGVIKSGELSRVTFYVFLLPLFSYIFGYAMLGDRLSLVQLSAGAVLLAAVYIAQRPGKPIYKEGAPLDHARVQT